MLHRNMMGGMERRPQGVERIDMLYRKLLPTEADLLRRHLLALTPGERRLRFQGGMADEAIERHVARTDWFRTVVTGCFVDGVLRGAAECVLDRSLRPQAAELAITVQTPWQHQGIGTELTRRAVMCARNRGVGHAVMLCLVENLPMRRIAQRLDGALDFEEGVIAADVGVRPATAWSLMEELVQDGTGLGAAMAGRLLTPPA